MKKVLTIIGALVLIIGSGVSTIVIAKYFGASDLLAGGLCAILVRLMWDLIVPE